MDGVPLRIFFVFYFAFYTEMVNIEFNSRLMLIGK